MRDLVMLECRVNDVLQPPQRRVCSNPLAHRKAPDSKSAKIHISGLQPKLQIYKVCNIEGVKKFTENDERSFFWQIPNGDILYDPSFAL